MSKNTDFKNIIGKIVCMRQNGLCYYESGRQCDYVICSGSIKADKDMAEVLAEYSREAAELDKQRAAARKKRRDAIADLLKNQIEK